MSRYGAITLLLLSLLAACGTDEDSPGGDGLSVSPTTQSATDDQTHVDSGGSPPEYEKPMLFVPGDYRPPSASVEARDRWEATLDAVRGSPQFNGIVAGFRLYGWKDASLDPSLEQKECVAAEFPEVAAMKITYLPAGTSARTPQYAGQCADGSTAWVVQEFIFKYGTFTVGYELGERAIGHDATAERVQPVTVVGREGVAIRPLIEEGNGPSIVAFHLDNGYVVVGAQNLPLSETLKIAEGVQCAGC